MPLVMEPIVRSMRPDEAETTARMWQRSQRAAYTWFREDQRHPLDDAIAFFKDSICQRCEVYVAVDENQRILGVLALEGDFLDHLFIDPDFWAAGIGSALLDHAKRLRPAQLTLVTLQRNERARRFYESRGFMVTKLGVSPPPENEPDVHYEWVAHASEGDG